MYCRLSDVLEIEAPEKVNGINQMPPWGKYALLFSEPNVARKDDSIL